MRDWAEDHWAGVGVVVFIAGAVVLSLIIALGFNIIATRHSAEAAGATSSIGATVGRTPSRMPAPAITSFVPKSRLSA